MGYFYFARHGQTVWNVENKICGATDIELTELGHQQATELGKKIKENKLIMFTSYKFIGINSYHSFYFTMFGNE